MTDSQITKVRKYTVSILAVLALSSIFFCFFTSYAHAGLGNIIKSTALSIIYTVATGVPAALVWLTGILFNFTINYFVVDMGSLINNQTGIGFAVNGLWEMIRDTMNLLFIFGLIYIGLKTILSSEDSGTRKALAQLIGAALLINFSLFISKAIIDFANTIAVQIYNLFIALGGQDAAGDITNMGYYGISGAYMDLLGILDLSATYSLFSDNGMGFVTGVIFSFMAMIFLFITAVVFGAGAFMLTARFIALIFYMIFSPVMFLGWILPSFNSYSKQWWSGFFQKAFFAPAYLFMLFLSYVALARFSVTDTERSKLGEFLLGNGSAEVVLYFVFAIGLLIGSIIVAQKMSIAGASTSMNVLNSAKNSIQGSAKSFAGRNTAGRFGNWMANKTEKNEGTRKGRNMNRLVTAATLGTYDTQSRIKSGKAMRSNTYGGSRSYESQEKWGEERGQMQLKGEKTARAEKAIDDGIKAPAGAAGDADRIAMEKEIRGLTPEQIKGMSKTEGGQKRLKGIVDKLTPTQIKALKEDKEIDEAFKDELMGIRRSKTHERTGIIPSGSTAPTAASIQEIRKISKEDLKSTDVKYLMQGAKYLQDSQIDDMKKMVDDGLLTATELQIIKDKRKEEINNSAVGGAASLAATREIIKTRNNEQEISKLPTDFLESNNFILALQAENKLSAKTLSKLATNDEVDTRRVGANVRAWMRTNPGHPDTPKLTRWLATPAAAQF